MLKQTIAAALSPLVGLDEPEVLSLLELPPDPELGDVAFPCFRLAKSLRLAPPQVAAQLAQRFEHPALTASVAGPYLNFRWERKQAAEQWIPEFLDDDFGHSDIGHGKRVILDMSSPNIAKPFGIGHLRSTMIGNALYHILREVGYETVNVNHLGDWGTQFGKMITAYRKWGVDLDTAGHTIQSYLELYVRFHDEAERDPSLEEEARGWFQRLEAGDVEATSLWQRFVEESLKEFHKLYARLGVSFDYELGESFYNDKMKPVVERLQASGLLVESEGAQVVPLEDQGLPPCLIVKSDGASIYATRDLATAIYRKEQLQGDIMLYVVGNEQALHFRQVFLVLEKLGYAAEAEFAHVPFGLMKLEGSKMSTRRGRVIFLEAVLDEAVSRVRRLIDEKNPTLADKDKVAEAIGIGAIVFGDLKHNRTMEVDFKLEEALKFDGETGPYVQYTYARTQSLLSKAGQTGGAAIRLEGHYLTSDTAWELIKHISRYPETLLDAAVHYEPSLLARYAVDLAQVFNRFYHDEKILTGHDAEQSAKLALVEAAGRVLRRSLTLLGIQTPPEI